VVKIKYNLVKFQDSDEANLTVFVGGEMYVATDTHPNFRAILDKVMAEDESVVDLFDVSKTAEKRFDRLSERVTVSNGRIYFDGEEVDNALTTQVLRFIDNGVEDFKPLVKFFEKVMTNPNEHSREQLYRWLSRYDFTITDEGDFIAYKGVQVVSDDHKYESISRGKAISNGVEYNGAIPNPLGAVVEMPRSNVQHDPSVGCHVGLHAGTWSYASGFAQGAVLTVVINPRDVVSVPTDCQDQKLRVCRYTVQEVTEVKYEAPVVSFDDEDEYDDEDYCYECGESGCEGECLECDSCGSTWCYDYECQNCEDCGEHETDCVCDEEEEEETPSPDLDAYVKGINTIEGFQRGYLGTDWPDAPWNK
jgi:hypothetical protein